MQQEVFDFQESYSVSWTDFIEGDENLEALQYMIQWPQGWRSNTTILVGESGVGKSHLAGLWAQSADAVFIAHDNLNDNPRDLFELNKNFIFDDFHEIIKDPETFAWLFHFLNIAHEKRRFVLLLSRTYPASWGISLNDLKSRLLLSPVVSIQPAQDELLFKIAQKMAKDLNVFIADDVLIYLLNIIDRSVSVLGDTLKRLNKISLQNKKAISMPFVRKYIKV